MEFVINYDDMNWAAIGPELIMLMTAFFILLAGLKKRLNTISFLSGVAMVGVCAAFLFTLMLWGEAPTVGNESNSVIFSGALIYDRFALVFNLIFLFMSLFAIFGSARYPQETHENKAEYFTLLLMALDNRFITEPFAVLIVPPVPPAAKSIEVVNEPGFIE